MLVKRLGTLSVPKNQPVCRRQGVLLLRGTRGSGFIVVGWWVFLLGLMMDLVLEHLEQSSSTHLTELTLNSSRTSHWSPSLRLVTLLQVLLTAEGTCCWTSSFGFYGSLQGTVQNFR